MKAVFRVRKTRSICDVLPLYLYLQTIKLVTVKMRCLERSKGVSAKLAALHPPSSTSINPSYSQYMTFQDKRQLGSLSHHTHMSESIASESPTEHVPEQTEMAGTSNTDRGRSVTLFVVRLMTVLSTASSTSSIFSL